MTFRFSNSGSRWTAVFVALIATALPLVAAMPEAAPVRASGREFARLPLAFEMNRGQAGAGVQFLARGRGYNFSIMPWGATMTFSKPARLEAAPMKGQRDFSIPAEARIVTMRLVAANPAPLIEGREPLPGRVNYFIGNDPAQWHTDVPCCQRVQLSAVYPGVDVVYYGAAQQLEYDFVFAPKANPSAVVIEFEGADEVRLADNGDLVLRVGADEIRQRRPVLHQLIRGERRAITGGYRILGAGRVGFFVCDYDRDETLVIDPVIDYASYLGGAKSDTAWDVVADATGAAYIAGESLSANLPAATNAFQTNFAGGKVAGDAFVARLRPDGAGFEYLTYIGGKGNDGALGLAVDTNGNAYITGFTDSQNFPTNQPLNPKLSGKVDRVTKSAPVDAFVTKLNSNGTALVFSTYLGGNLTDEGVGIALDAAGNVYVAGFTDSTNFPVASAVQATRRGGFDAFVTGINAAGSAYLFSTYLGGTNTDRGTGVDVDPAGNVLVSGFTFSTNFPVANAFQGTLGTLVFTNASSNVVTFQGFDAFVTKFAPGGTQLVYSTYLGGYGDDQAYRIKADSAGNAFVTGFANPGNFPVTNAPTFLANGTNSSLDAFVSKYSPAGQLVNSTLFGGTNRDQAIALALDGGGRIYVAGNTTSPALPTAGVVDASSLTNHGLNDVFIFALDPDFSALRYSMFLGGGVDDFAYGLDVDLAGNAYVVGKTVSADLPVTGGLQPAFAGGTGDAFVARIIVEPQLSIQFTGGNIVVSWPAPSSDLANPIQFILQTRSTAANANWVYTLYSQAFSNSTYFVTVPSSSPPAFFRLVRR